MTIRVVLSVVFAFPFIACGGDAGPSDATEPTWPDWGGGAELSPISFTDFCSRTEAAQRDLFIRCLPGLGEAVYDLTEAGWVDRPKRELRPCHWDRPREGLVEFDGLAAARCVQGVESLDCGSVPPDLVDVCWSVLGDGVLPVGSPCESRLECREGRCASMGCRVCEADDSESLQEESWCTGGNCDPTYLPEGHTCDSKRVSAGLERCAAAGGGWIWVGCVRGRCTRDGVLGDPCEKDGDCVHYYKCVDSQCVVSGRHGDPCEEAQDCLFGRCGSNAYPPPSEPEPMTCFEPMLGRFEGDPCRGACSGSELYCDPSTSTCQYPLGPGVPCDPAYPLRCLTGDCQRASKAGEAAVCAPLLPDGMPCDLFSEGRDCASGNCVGQGQACDGLFVVTYVCATCPLPE